MSHLFRQALLGLSMLFATAAGAAEQPFDQARFAALMQQGRPVLVAIHADWCSTCRRQAPLVQALLAEPRFADVALLRVDFDRQKDVVRDFRASIQSTLIMHRAGREVGRSVAVTSRDAIAELLAAGR